MGKLRELALAASFRVSSACGGRSGVMWEDGAQPDADVDMGAYEYRP